jgi:hypothetical protein
VAKQQQHSYRNCQDETCYRLACRAWHEGYEDGRAQGQEEGREQAEAKAGK